MSSISSISSSMSSMYAQQSQRPSKADMEQKLSSDFSSADVDGNGTLSADELAQMMSKMGPKSSESSSTSSTSDTSSSTSSSEASSKATELMSASDSNGDGELSLEEMKAGMEKMHSNLQSKGDMMKQRMSEQSNQNSQGGGFEQDMQSLSDAINSGDLESAKTILEQIQSHKPKESETSSSTDSTESQRDKDFKALSEALDSRDSTAITTAMQTIQTNMQQGSGNNSNSSTNNSQSINLQALISKMVQSYSTQSSSNLSSLLASA